MLKNQLILSSLPKKSKRKSLGKDITQDQGRIAIESSRELPPTSAGQIIERSDGREASCGSNAGRGIVASDQAIPSQKKQIA